MKPPGMTPEELHEVARILLNDTMVKMGMKDASPDDPIVTTRELEPGEFGLAHGGFVTEANGEPIFLNPNIPMSIAEGMKRGNGYYEKPKPKLTRIK